MIALILYFLLGVFGLLAIASGTIVLYRLFSKGLSYKIVSFFLQVTLLACAMTLCVSLLQEPTLHWSALVAVYAAVPAVFIWRKRKMYGAWALIFVASLIAVYCLNLLAFFSAADRFLCTTFSCSIFPWAGITVFLLFCILSGIAFVHIRGKGTVQLDEYDR